MDLFSEKYTQNIIVQGTNLIDKETGVFFSVLGEQYVFKNEKDLVWYAKPQILTIDGKSYNLNGVENFWVKNGITFFFAEKREIIRRALYYFENFIVEPTHTNFIRNIVFKDQDNFYTLKYVFFRPPYDKSTKVEYSFN
jgi:hypothetical protein